MKKTTRRILSLVTVFALLIAALPMSALAATEKSNAIKPVSRKEQVVGKASAVVKVNG